MIKRIKTSSDQITVIGRESIFKKSQQRGEIEWDLVFLEWLNVKDVKKVFDSGVQTIFIKGNQHAS